MSALMTELLENETKESLAILYADSLSRERELKLQIQRMLDYLNPLLEIAKCSVK